MKSDEEEPQASEKPFKLPLRLQIIWVWDTNDPVYPDVPHLILTGLEGFTKADLAHLPK